MRPASLLEPASSFYKALLYWLAQADLEHAGSYDTPIKGCDYVIHTASPVIMRPPKGKARAVPSYSCVRDTGSLLQLCSAQRVPVSNVLSQFSVDTVAES